MKWLKEVALVFWFFLCIPYIWVMSMLTECAWYRKWRGGHWERWYYTDPVWNAFWDQHEICSVVTGRRRDGLMRGTPVCEDWPGRNNR